MKPVAFDTETRGLNWAEEDERAFLGQWAHRGGWGNEWHAVLSIPEDAQAYAEGLTSADMIIAHNLSFDIHQTRATIGLDLMDYWEDGSIVFHDTDLISRILLPEGQRKDRGGHGLKNLATYYVDKDAARWEDKIIERGKEIGYRSLKGKGRYYDVWRAFPEDMEAYGRSDVRYTMDLFDVLWPLLEANPTAMRLYELELEVARILIRAEQRGTKVDQEAVERLHTYYQELRAPVVDRLEQELGFVPEGTGSQEALREALLTMGVPLTKRTQGTKKLSVSRDALMDFEQSHPVIKDLFEFRRINKFLQTYIGPTRGRDTVHPSFMQAEAWTGRMSCRNPNMQNVPKRRDLSDDNDLKVRSVFVPREGYGLVVSDYESIELRYLAWFMGVQSYRDLIRDGLDGHAYTASVVWPCKTHDKADGGPRFHTSMVKGGVATTPEDFGKKTDGRVYRDIAKHTTYAIIYGAGAPKVTEQINRMVPKDMQITLADARLIIDRIKDALKGYRYLTQKRIRPKIQSEGFVTTRLGRKQVVDPEKHYVGLNALIQGSAADAMKRGMVAVDKALRERGLDAHIILVVHDELVVECRLDQIEECEALVRKVMAAESDPDLDPPLEVESGWTEESYAHAK